MQPKRGRITIWNGTRPVIINSMQDQNFLMGRSIILKEEIRSPITRDIGIYLHKTLENRARNDLTFLFSEPDI